MVDSVEIKTEETTSEKPVEEKQSTQSVQGLPEKFKSVEDLAKSYSELEKKLGEQTPQQEEVDPINATKLKGEESKPEVKPDTTTASDEEKENDRTKALKSVFTPLKNSFDKVGNSCLLYTSPSPRDRQKSRMPSSA